MFQDGSVGTILSCISTSLPIPSAPTGGSYKPARTTSCKRTGPPSRLLNTGREEVDPRRFDFPQSIPCHAGGAITPGHQPEGWAWLPSPPRYHTGQTDADRQKRGNDGARPKRPCKIAPRHTGTNGFPFSNFKHSLTLFSKFFSSFPHGTFSLSVYCQYLALDGIYHPF